jgi:hypothetical protein
MSKQREALSNRTIINGLPDIYRSYDSESEDDDCSVEHCDSESEDDRPVDQARLKPHEHYYNPTGETEDAARYRRNQTNRVFAMTQANHAYYKRVSESRLKKPTYSRKALVKDFQSANQTLKVRWQECNASHAEKLMMARNHNKRMEPHTKGYLLKNLQKKMRSFERKLEHLPLVLDVDTDPKRFAYIQDAESITKGLDACINWEWDNQAIEYMGF